MERTLEWLEQILSEPHESPDYDGEIERLDKLIDSRPTDIPEKERTRENLLRLQIGHTISMLTKLRDEEEKQYIRSKNKDKTIENLQHLIANFGFRMVGQGVMGCYSQRSLMPCPFGHAAQVQESFYEDGKWLVKCPTCDLTTEPFAKIRDAVKAWNMKKYTETSIQFNKRYTMDTMDEEGCVALTERAVEVAAEDYIYGDADMKKSVKSFIQKSKLLGEIDRDAAIDALDKRAEEREENLKKQRAGAYA